MDILGFRRGRVGSGGRKVNTVMKILAIGDVVGKTGIEYLSKHLWDIRRNLCPDLVIANGENASEIHGISSCDAKALLDCGVNLITLGNHAFGCRDIGDFLDSNPDKIIRPANYPAVCAGNGYTVLKVDGVRLLCINVSGTAFLDALDNPFDTVDRILAREAGRYDIAVLDLHAEATSEKYAMARYFDGRIHVIFGTHTHVTTADEQILRGGTGYITDLGMTGPVDSVIGTDTDSVIYKMRTHMPTRFTVAKGEVKAHAALFALSDSAPYRVLSVERIVF